MRAVDLTPAQRRTLTRARGARSLSEVAREIGISGTALGYFERGERSPTPEVFAAWCAAVGVDLVYRPATVEAKA